MFSIWNSRFFFFSFRFFWSRTRDIPVFPLFLVLNSRQLFFWSQTQYNFFVSNWRNCLFFIFFYLELKTTSFSFSSFFLSFFFFVLSFFILEYETFLFSFKQLTLYRPLFLQSFFLVLGVHFLNLSNYYTYKF